MSKNFTKKNDRFITKDSEGNENGSLITIYNNTENLYPDGYYPSQVYLTTLIVGKVKGPHLHYKRDGLFTCIRGDVRIILKDNGKYKIFKSGENYDYASIFIPRGVPAAIQNISSKEAYLLNMPNPAWTKEMDDEFTDDFSDFNFDI